MINSVKVEDLTPLAHGNFGLVYEGKIGGQKAALKRLKETQGGDGTKLRKEVEAIMSVGDHVNVLKFIGAISVRLWPGCEIYYFQILKVSVP